MRLAVLSLFRDCTNSHLTRWVNQVRALAAHVPPGYSVHPLAVEGDSQDHTRDRLLMIAHNAGLPINIVDCQVGVPKFGSCVDPVRLSALSKCLNAGLDAVTPDIDQVLYVESDLLWDPDTMGVLSDTLADKRGGPCDVVAPMIFVDGTRQFYDIWGFRKGGLLFDPGPPYHKALNGQRYLEVDSVGSCLAITGALARRVRVNDGQALVGWCNMAVALEHRVLVDTKLSVRHPRC